MTSLPTYNPIPSSSPATPSRHFSARRVALVCGTLFLLSVTFIFLYPVSSSSRLDSSRAHMIPLDARPPYIPAPTFPNRVPPPSATVDQLRRIPAHRMHEREAVAHQLYYAPPHQHIHAYPMSPYVRPHFFPPNNLRTPSETASMHRVNGEMPVDATSVHERRMEEEMRRWTAMRMDPRVRDAIMQRAMWGPVSGGINEKETVLKETAEMSRERAQKMEQMRQEAMNRYAEMKQGHPVFRADVEKQNVPLLAHSMMNIA